LCTFAEVLYASSGDENRRFPWGDDYALRCEPDVVNPVDVIGAHPECVSPEGVFDLGVRGTWARLDPTSQAWFHEQFGVELPAGELVITGSHFPGKLPFFAPNNYGVHGHVHDGGIFDVGRFPGGDWMDDGLRVCADPEGVDPAVEAEWQAVQDAFAESEDYALLWAFGPPPGVSSFTATAVAAGWFHTCALDDEGEVRCWGDDGHGRLDAPAGPFVELDAGWHHTCAHRADGAIACWGGNEKGQSDVPPEPFEQLAVGFLHTCGLRDDGSVLCWGSDESGQLEPPDGVAFQRISAGRYQNCGSVVGSGSIRCWGSEDWPIAPAPPQVDVVELWSGEVHHCAADSEGSLSCWGDNGISSGNPPKPDSYLAVAAGAMHSCGVRPEGEVQCWGDLVGRGDAPAGRFGALAAGAVHTCGIRDDGRIACWGGNGVGQSSPP
jgi:hypothetical protein